MPTDCNALLPPEGILHIHLCRLKAKDLVYIEHSWECSGYFVFEHGWSLSGLLIVASDNTRTWLACIIWQLVASCTWVSWAELWPIDFEPLSIQSWYLEEHGQISKIEFRFDYNFFLWSLKIVLVLLLPRGLQIYFHISRNDPFFMITALLVALWNVPGREGVGPVLKEKFHIGLHIYTYTPKPLAVPIVSISPIM